MEEHSGSRDPKCTVAFKGTVEMDFGLLFFSGCPHSRQSDFIWAHDYNLLLRVPQTPGKTLSDS